MIKINNYDIVLTFSPICEITGHIFEVFDYFLILRKRFRTLMFFMSTLSMEDFRTCWESKYSEDFPEEFIRIEDYNNLDNLINFGKDSIVLLTDGNIRGLQWKNVYLTSKKMFGFMCFDYDFKSVQFSKSIEYLQDFRIYGENPNFKSRHYVKKIPFQYYKKFNTCDDCAMMYLTFECRKLTREKLIECLPEDGQFTRLVVPFKIKDYEDIPNTEQIVSPVPNFFEKFSKYIYTNVNNKFDCSPRLITEAMLFGKEVDIKIDYEDKALNQRLFDFKYDLDSIILKDDDEIIKIFEEELSR